MIQLAYVVERRLYPNPYQEDFLNKKFRICHKIYNTAIRHYKKVIDEIQQDQWFLYNRDQYLTFIDDKKKSKEYANEISVCMTAYGLNEYDIHAYIGAQKTAAFANAIGINIVQKLGTSVYQAIKKVLFSTGKEIHYRKKGHTLSFEDKRANSGIIYKESNDSVKVMGMEIMLKPIRWNDRYLMEAMKSKVKYCRIIRKPLKTGYKFFLQLIMDGCPPKKIRMGSGRIGLDPGVSTIALYGDHTMGFHVLANGVEKYDQLIKQASMKYERRRRLNNPEHYNPDGTVIKGAKNWTYTHGMYRALFELKDAYRKKTAFVKQSHGNLSNEIVEHCSEIIKEPMNYQALAKKAKETSRQMKAASVKTATGIKNIRKYKRKKRFGTSINRRSPGAFISILTNKMIQYGGIVVDIDILKYKASQYNHVTKEAIRVPLSCRVKEIDGFLVQRDLYSAFLLYGMKTIETIDFEVCNKKFPEFLKLQEIVKQCIHSEGDPTQNFKL